MKKIIFIFLILFCHNLLAQSDSITKYFNKVVYNNEYIGQLNFPLKWKQDVNIYVMGEKPDYLISELKKIVNELNSLIKPIKINIVNYEDKSNFIVYFGSHTYYGDHIEPYSKPYLNSNHGLFAIYGEEEITSGSMFVDIYRTKNNNSRKHLLREELTQSLGLQNDTYDYPSSIFYQGWTETTEYAEIDKELIKMLYNK